MYYSSLLQLYNKNKDMPEVIIPGPDGRLEGKYHHNQSPSAPIAIVMHPNPLYGGTMNNKVVYNIYKNFVHHGFSVLRFNFRGVGKSQGKFDDGIGELNDAASCLDWMQQYNMDASSCWVAGFSFGSWVAMQLLMRRPEIEGFIISSPPANLYDFSFLAPCPSSGLVTHGDKDDVVLQETVSTMAKRLNAQSRGVDVDFSLIKGADHYYRERADELNQVIDDYLTSRRDNIHAKRNFAQEKRRRKSHHG